MAQNNRAVRLGSITGPGEVGPRPSMQPIRDAIDPNDPAFVYMIAELQQVRREGGALNDQSITRAAETGRARLAEEQRLNSIPKSIVYYIRRSHLIKIGTTTSPKKRFLTLLPDEILAWEPGGYAEEASRHAQFDHLRIRRVTEYFRPAVDLTEHIDQVRSVHGAPHPTWPTLENLEGRPGRSSLLPPVPQSAELVSLLVGAKMLGIRSNTARVWVHRGKLEPLLEDFDGKPLYLLDDIAALARLGGCASKATKLPA